MASIRAAVRACFPPGTTGRWLISGIYRNPIRFPIAIIRSLWASRRLTGHFFPIKVLLGVGQNLKVYRANKVNIVIDGTLRVVPWGGTHSDSSISVAEGASLRILGDFEIGPAVHISVSRSASLRIQGQVSSTGSGITCNSRIMVEQSIEIGADCIIAWDVFISDSDWHEIKDSPRSVPIIIGDNVWVAHGASIVKGATIPSGCIVGAKSLVGRGEFPPNALIAGVPAGVKRLGVTWIR